MESVPWLVPSWALGRYISISGHVDHQRLVSDVVSSFEICHGHCEGVILHTFLDIIASQFAAITVTWVKRRLLVISWRKVKKKVKNLTAITTKTSPKTCLDCHQLCACWWLSTNRCICRYSDGQVYIQCGLTLQWLSFTRGPFTTVKPLI